MLKGATLLSANSCGQCHGVMWNTSASDVAKVLQSCNSADGPEIRSSNCVLISDECVSLVNVGGGKGELD